MDEFLYIRLGLAGGAAAFAHCMGMCGGFALHLAGGRRGAVIARQALWHAGRITTYVFLGTLAGALGGFVGSVQRWAWLSDVLAYVTGAIMVIMGLKLLGLLPYSILKKKQKKQKQRGQDARDTHGQDAHATQGRDRVPKRDSSRSGTPALAAQGQEAHATGPAARGFLSAVFAPLLTRPTAGGALALGLVGGFLPCPVVMFFLALSAQSRSASTGMATMAAMGVGTVWSLVILGAVGGALRSFLRRWGGQVAGIVLIVMGAATTLRGSDAFHRLIGCPMQNETACTCHEQSCVASHCQEATAASQPSCCCSHPSSRPAPLSEGPP